MKASERRESLSVQNLRFLLYVPRYEFLRQ
jgi:hypothetical protein